MSKKSNVRCRVTLLEKLVESLFPVHPDINWTMFQMFLHKFYIT